MYFSYDFDGYTNGNSAMTQAGTGLTVEANGDLPGWTKNLSAGNIHAVDRSGSGNFAVMLYDGNLMYYATPIAANTLGASYTVAFDGAIAVYAAAYQATAAGDYVQFLINDANGTIGSYKYTPTSTAFSPASFTYTGSGLAGGVYLVMMDGNPGDGRFGGAIDNVSVRRHAGDRRHRGAGADVPGAADHRRGRRGVAAPPPEGARLASPRPAAVPASDPGFRNVRSPGFSLSGPAGRLALAPRGPIVV